MQTGNSKVRHADHEQDLNGLQSKPVKSVLQDQREGFKE
jgi:hypothetical protein